MPVASAAFVPSEMSLVLRSRRIFRICGNQATVVSMAATAPTISNRGTKAGLSRKKHASCGASYARTGAACEGGTASGIIGSGGSNRRGVCRVRCRQHFSARAAEHEFRDRCCGNRAATWLRNDRDVTPSMRCRLGAGAFPRYRRSRQGGVAVVEYGANKSMIMFDNFTQRDLRRASRAANLRVVRRALLRKRVREGEDRTGVR